MGILDRQQCKKPSAPEEKFGIAPENDHRRQVPKINPKSVPKPFHPVQPSWGPQRYHPITHTFIHMQKSPQRPWKKKEKSQN